MAENTNTRRERGRREAFFLEGVRELLKSMSTELAEVKACVKDLQFSLGAGQFPTVVVAMPDWTWGSLPMWYPTEFANVKPDNEENLSSTAASHPVSAKVNVLKRETLLAYQGASAGMEIDASLPVAVSGSTAFGTDTQCTKCKQGTDMCICFDVYCRNCVKPATKCNWQSPMVLRRSCAGCQFMEPVDSLFESTPLPNLPETSVCQNCNSSQYLPYLGDDLEYNGLQGAQPCRTCGRVDAQEALLNCHGSCDCLHHSFCMVPVMEANGCQHRTKLYLCELCHRSGIVPRCPDCIVELDENSDDAALDGNPQLSDPDTMPQYLKEAVAAGEKREQVLASFERRMESILELIDSVDEGTIKLPKPARDLTYGAVKDSYAWFQTRPPTEEIEAKIDYLDGLMDKVTKKSISKT